MYIRLASQASLPFPPTYFEVITFRSNALKVGDFYKNSIKFNISDAEKIELNSSTILYGIRKGTLEGAISEVTPDNSDVLDEFYNTKKVNVLLEDEQNNEFYYIGDVVINIDEEFDGSKSKIYLKIEKEFLNKEDYRKYFGYIFKVTPSSTSFDEATSKIIFNYDFDHTKILPGFAQEDIVRVFGSLLNNGDYEVLEVSFGAGDCFILVDGTLKEEQGTPEVTIEKVGTWE